MNASIKKYLFKQRFVKLTELLLISASISVAIFLCLFFFSNKAVIFSLLAFLLLILFGGYYLYKKYNYQNASIDLNNKIIDLEYSTDLLNNSDENLSSIEKIQKQKIQSRIENSISLVKIENKIPNYLLLLIFVLSIGILIAPYKHLLNFTSSTESQNIESFQKNIVPNETMKDVLTNQPPKLLSTSASVSPPNYTKLSIKNFTLENLEVLENSTIRWQLTCSENTDKVKFVKDGLKKTACQKNKNKYIFETVALNNFVFNFELESNSGLKYTSEIFEIKVNKDATPIISINKDDVIYLEYYEIEPQNVSLKINDDFGIDKVELFTTVSSGSGESVKFRDSTILVYKNKNGTNDINLNQKINLPEWNLKPGEEFYYHFKAYDNKVPKPNIGRSNNFLIVIEDTTEVASFVGSDFPINTMPAYFRSQRQIIIDTEKLIAKKSTISEEEYLALSNEIANDQKILRLRYGKFLGEEFESTAGGGSHNHESHDHDSNLETEEEHIHTEDCEHDHNHEGHEGHNHKGHNHEHDHNHEGHEEHNHEGHDHEGHDHEHDHNHEGHEGP